MNSGDTGEYLARISLSGPPAPDPAGLAAVVRAHRLAIPFENLDIPLGRGIALAPEAIFAKLVSTRRGGYCFEQNLLLRRMLGEFGLQAQPLLARVVMGLPAGSDLPPRTHLFLKARIAGQVWLADAGFGGGYAPPMVLSESDPVRGPDSVLHRLRRLGPAGTLPGEWQLERSADEGATWQPQYCFDDLAVAPADIECANHWTATRPGSRFTTLHIASLVTPTGLASLVDHTFTASGEESQTVASAKDWHRLLTERFTLPLSPAEVAALPLFAAPT